MNTDPVELTITQAPSKLANSAIAARNLSFGRISNRTAPAGISAHLTLAFHFPTTIYFATRWGKSDNRKSFCLPRPAVKRKATVRAGARKGAKG